ncbi:MAG: AMP-binding protein [Arenicella sp.]|nr:AMP-binding protein [Arenicella sp.]
MNFHILAHSFKSMPASSVYQQLVQSASQYSELPFLHIPANALGESENFDASYADTVLQADKLKAGYSDAGLRIGDRVAILFENKAEFFFHWFALNALGVCVVPVNSELMPDEVGYLLEHSDVCCAVGFEHKLEVLSAAVERFNLGIPVVADHAIGELNIIHRTEVAEQIDLNTECAILYTSGSTGKPKGCLLTNDYFLSSGAWYRDAGGYCELKKGVERLITPLPLVHMNAMACSTMGMMMTGGCLIQLDRFHPRSWWQSVRDTKATVLHYLGVMPAILLNLPLSDSDDFSQQIKFGFGAGVNPVHHAVFEHRFGFPLIESWGMTETGCTNCITAIQEPRHVGTSCIGKQPDRLDVKLVNEQGTAVAKGEPGELLVRAKGDNPRQGFFSGYYKNQAATDEAWKDGWLHTGDIVRQGEDDSLHFVDRLKNVIRRSGENVSALEVEATLSLCEQVEAVAVTAVPDEIRGDEVIACIIPANGIELEESTAEEIFLQAAKALSYFKLPGYVAFVDALPLTASNKPQRAELKKLARRIVTNEEQSTRYFDLRSLKKKGVGTS